MTVSEASPLTPAAFSRTRKEESREAVVPGLGGAGGEQPENSRQLLAGAHSWLDAPPGPSSELLGAHPQEPTGSETLIGS